MPIPAIAVLGAGTIGRTLAGGWASAGYPILLGSRTPDSERMEDAVREVRGSGTAPVAARLHADAAAQADIVAVSVPGEQVSGLVTEIGEGLAGKIVIDTTNNLSDGAASLNAIATLTGTGAIVCRTFNTVGWEQIARPQFGQLRSDMPYTGPEQSRTAVEALISALGFRPIHLGADQLAVDANDGLARLWFLLAFRQGYGRRLGLRFLTAADDQ